MMRQALLQCLRSPKRTPKPKPFWFDDHTHAFVRTKMLWSPPRHCHHFCTASPPPYKGLTVTRSVPELVGPAGPTPRGLRLLSSVDESAPLRVLVPMVQIYRHDPSMRGVDPARVIRGALARALVSYYPLAGRLREGPHGGLSVDCTSQGVGFVEAEADARLDELTDPPRPQFPWLQEFNAPVPEEIINSPLMNFQVTRLKCGGFVLAICLNHIMCDAGGLTQFLNAVGEIARGAISPSIAPVWKRELFIAPNIGEPKNLEPPPTIDRETPVNNLDLVQRHIFLGPSELSAIRMLVPEHLRSHTTTFEILTAFLWQCRASALEPRDITTLGLTVSARDKTNRVIPNGYYGNAFGVAWSETSARELLERPIEYAIGLVKKAKEKGTKGCVIGYPTDSSPGKMLFVSDVRQLGYGDVDFGWGKPAYAGLAKFEADGIASYSPFRNHDGADGILVLICMQRETMVGFETQVNNVTINRN